MKWPFALIGLAAFGLVACGGGGGSGSSQTPATQVVTPAPLTSVTQTISVSTSAPQTSQYTLTGVTGAVTFPTASVGTTMSSTFSTTQPAGTPAIQNLKRRPRSIGASPIGAIAFLCVTPNATTTLSAYPSFALGASPAILPAGGLVYIAFYDPTNAAAGWTTIEGPVTASPSTLTFTGAAPGPTLTAGQAACFLFFTVASALPTPTPTPTPSVTSQSQSVSISTTASQTVTYAIQNYGDMTAFPTGDVATTLSTTFTTVLPSGLPSPQALRLPSQTISNSSVAADAYLCVTPAATVTLSAWPSFSLTVPQALAGSGGSSYVAVYNPVAAVWSEVEGPASASGSAFTFTNSSAGPTLLRGQTYCFALVTLPASLPTPSPVTTTAAGVPAWTPTQHRGYVAAIYGGGSPQYIAIYAPGQTVASATITYNSCCLNQLQFDSQGNLIVAAGNDGMFKYAPGTTASPTAIFPGPGGTALALDPQNTIAIGGRSHSVAVYPSESTAAMYSVPGAPDLSGSLALSPSGELAVPQADGTVTTFARGATTANRTLPINALFNGINFTFVAYDCNGNLAAVANGSQTTINVYAPGATTPMYTIGGFSEVQSMAFDSANRLVVGDFSSIQIFAAGGSTLVATIPNNRPVGLAVDPLGDIAMAGFGSVPTIVYQANAHNTVIGSLFENGSIAISP